MRDFDWKIIYTLRQTGSVTQAAKLLFVTQPTLTRRIQLIEEELGFPILVRGSKGIVLTPAGEHVADYSEKMLDLMDQMQLELAGFSNGDSGPLRLGAPPAYALYVMPPFIEKFTERYPNVKLDLIVEHSEELKRMVENRELDVAFCRDHSDSGTTRFRLVSDTQVHIVASRPFDLDDLPTMPRIDFVRENGVAHRADRWWAEHFSTPPYIRMRMSSCQHALALVQYNMGYAIISDPKYLKNLKDEVYALPMFFRSGEPFTSKTYLIYHKDREYDPLLKNLLAFMDEVDINTLR